MGKLTLNAQPGKQEFIITRIFDVPRARLFKAMLDPALIPQWWGPRKYVTIVDRMEPRPGGLWRFINRGADGQEFAFHGVYHAILSPERVVQTFEFEGASGNVSLETATLEDRGAKTLWTTHAVFQSVEARDAMLQSGMEEGTSETYDRLEELVAKM